MGFLDKISQPLVDSAKALAQPVVAETKKAVERLSIPSPDDAFDAVKGLAEEAIDFQTGLKKTLRELLFGPDNRIPGGSSIYDDGMFHAGAEGAPKTYAFENSPAGIKFAAEHGYSSIDLDMQITEDGVPVNTHWSQPMAKDGFYDPLGKLDADTKVSEMTLAEVMRLRNRDGESVILPMAAQIALLKKYGIAGDLEAKFDPRFATDEIMGQIADMVRENGVTANLKTIDYGEQSMEILEEAQEHGFWVRTAKGNGKEARELGYGS